MSPEGKPIQLNASALQAAAAQNAIGRFLIFNGRIVKDHNQELSLISKGVYHALNTCQKFHKIWSRLPKKFFFFPKYLAFADFAKLIDYW